MSFVVRVNSGGTPPARGSLTAVGDLFTTPTAEVFDMRLKTPSASIRQRVESFSSLLNEGALQSVAKGKITLQGVQQKLSDTLERQLGGDDVHFHPCLVHWSVHSGPLTPQLEGAFNSPPVWKPLTTQLPDRTNLRVVTSAGPQLT